ncbi:unnamed protein product [Sphagnum jensenii]|uniref:Uncharacterized protein n=1 Tax=Sphagnum jensenii TaxID=128206 RepID=A0ABP0VM42_9BRYO
MRREEEICFMITAEYTDRIKIEDDHSRGGIPINIGEYYTECAVINYLREDIFAIGFDNKPLRIQQHPRHVFSDRKLVIRSWQISGKRTWQYQSGNNFETTPNTHDVFSIPYELIREQPVFVETLNAVVCFADQIPFVKHPHSKESIKEQIEILECEIANRIQSGPLAVIANDPRGVYKTLYVDIGGYICSVPVTHLKFNPDSILVGMRTKDHPSDPYTREYTTFAAQLRIDEKIWRIGGLTISPDKAWLEQILEAKRLSSIPTVASSKVDALIDDIRSKDVETIKELTEQLKEMKRRLTISEANFKSLEDGDYQEMQAKLAYQNLKPNMKKSNKQIEMLRQIDRQKEQNYIVKSFRQRVSL